MIRINLLPEEYRKKQRTPLAAFAAVLVGVLFVASSSSYFLFLNFGLVANARAERAQVEDQILDAQTQTKFHSALVAEKTDYEKREAKIREIGGSRVLWTRKFDQLADILNAGEDSGRYTIWFKSFSLDQVVDAKAETGGKAKGEGLSASGNYANVANFFADVEGTEFFRDFIAINNPSGHQTEPSKDLIPAQVWEFDLHLALKPGAKPPAPAPPAPATPAANGAKGGG